MKTLLTILFAVVIGNSQSLKKELEPFTKLELELNCFIQIKFSDEHKIEVTGQDDVLKGLEIRVSGRTLHITHERNRDSFSSMFSDDVIRNRSVDVILYTKRLDKVELSGEGEAKIEHFVQNVFELSSKGEMDISASGEAEEIEINNIGIGSIKFDKIAAEEVNVSNIGPGVVRLEGKTDELNVNIIGPGDILAFDLEADVLDANIIGPGDLKVHVLKKISANFIGPGNVIYKGDPDIVDDSGIGPGEVRRY
jgi:hypothetical protein